MPVNPREQAAFVDLSHGSFALAWRNHVSLIIVETDPALPLQRIPRCLLPSFGVFAGSLGDFFGMAAAAN